MDEWMYFLVFKPYLPSWTTFFNKLNNLVIFLSGTVMSPMDFFSREIFIKWQLWHDGLKNKNKWLSINTSILQKVVSALPVQCHTAKPILFLTYPWPIKIPLVTTFGWSKLLPLLSFTFRPNQKSVAKQMSHNFMWLFKNAEHAKLIYNWSWLVALF